MWKRNRVLDGPTNVVNHAMSGLMAVLTDVARYFIDIDERFR